MHNVTEYPIYYDALYYPQYHAYNFDTPDKFCAWLLKSLVSHHRSCHTCSFEFRGCVAFNGFSVVVTDGHRSLSLRPSEFESSGYRHCVLLCRFSVCGCDGLASSLARKFDCLPAWIDYDEQTIVTHLFISNLSSRESLSVEKCLPLRLDVYLRWFRYRDSEEIQEQNLPALLDNVLAHFIATQQ
ncbi:hypothetical protein DFJ58DRAFT_362573 [Suillus subalutaceus]|uniref:uncharacterized protein n=1 Tax=Suillus subalutaceus TaxID=48586 RepID=UPI001B85C220|nr:uncharacterized protein DFJ58DRAFT_362573 [Suillus subalutaceus]KAG1873527.1 hypothetical protein DFJ58DRAFT_362573 [Suillus subalutaceus]